ncbi:hypothetical protein JOD25_002834 [Kurthia huakuii]|nr:hypothetical protein [Kurthia huakuii]MBM7700483.1 hypothetical protein [Kurthia huakuii]
MLSTIDNIKQQLKIWTFNLFIVKTYTLDEMELLLRPLVNFKSAR